MCRLWYFRPHFLHYHGLWLKGALAGLAIEEVTIWSPASSATLRLFSTHDVEHVVCLHSRCQVQSFRVGPAADALETQAPYSLLRREWGFPRTKREVMLPVAQSEQFRPLDCECPGMRTEATSKENGWGD